MQGPPLSILSSFWAGPPEGEMRINPSQAPCEQSAGLTLPTCMQSIGAPNAVLINNHAMMPSGLTCVQDVGGSLAGFVKGPFLHNVALHQLQGARQGLAQLGKETILPAAACWVDTLRQQAQLLWAAERDATAKRSASGRDSGMYSKQHGRAWRLCLQAYLVPPPLTVPLTW